MSMFSALSALRKTSLASQNSGDDAPSGYVSLRQQSEGDLRSSAPEPLFDYSQRLRQDTGQQRFKDDLFDDDAGGPSSRSARSSRSNAVAAGRGDNRRGSFRDDLFDDDKPGPTPDMLADNTKDGGYRDTSRGPAAYPAAYLGSMLIKQEKLCMRNVQRTISTCIRGGKVYPMKLRTSDQQIMFDCDARKVLIPSARIVEFAVYDEGRDTLAIVEEPRANQFLCHVLRMDRGKDAGDVEDVLEYALKGKRRLT